MDSACKEQTDRHQAKHTLQIEIDFRNVFNCQQCEIQEINEGRGKMVTVTHLEAEYDSSDLNPVQGHLQVHLQGQPELRETESQKVNNKV